MTLAAGVDRTRADAQPHFRVLGPEEGGLSLASLRRLFKGQHITSARKHSLAHGGRMVAMWRRKAVGLAAYEWTDHELRVGELGIDQDSECESGAIVEGLLEALELAATAGGVPRLVLLPRAGIFDGALRRRGYTAIAQVAAGTWFEKRLG